LYLGGERKGNLEGREGRKNLREVGRKEEKKVRRMEGRKDENRRKEGGEQKEGTGRDGTGGKGKRKRESGRETEASFFSLSSPSLLSLFPPSAPLSSPVCVCESSNCSSIQI
jgi:hypothetical protein